MKKENKIMNNTITIPAEILNEAGINENDLLEFYVDEFGRIIVQPVSPEDEQSVITKCKGEYFI